MPTRKRRCASRGHGAGKSIPSEKNALHSSRQGTRHAHHRLPLPLVAAADLRAAVQAHDLSALRAQRSRRLHYIGEDGGDLSSTAGPSGSISTSSSSTWTGSATRSAWCARSDRSRSTSPICRPRRGATPRCNGTRRWRGRSANIPAGVWASAAVPLTDTRIAIEVLDHAINALGLMGVNIPGSIGRDPRIDAERLAPFYARVEELGVPMFLHPTDAVFGDDPGRVWRRAATEPGTHHRGERGGVAHRALRPHGAASQPQDRHVAHRRRAALSVGPHGQERQEREAAAPPSTYIRRMFTDTVSPHSAGMKFAIEYYGIDHVMYGSDYPCWDPATALALLDEIKLSDADKEKLFNSNARRILGLRDPVPAARNPEKALAADLDRPIEAISAQKESGAPGLSTSCLTGCRGRETSAPAAGRTPRCRAMSSARYRPRRTGPHFPSQRRCRASRGSAPALRPTAPSAPGPARRSRERA